MGLLDRLFGNKKREEQSAVVEPRRQTEDIVTKMERQDRKYRN